MTQQKEYTTIICPHCTAHFKRKAEHERDRPLQFCAYCGHLLKKASDTKDTSLATTQLPEHLPKQDEIQKTIGPYHILSSIGKGGMGEVFLAYDTICGRKIALKQIRSDLIMHPQLQRRFLREAEITSQLTHPIIIPIYSIHKSTHLTYYTMPYLEGSTLRQVLRRAKLDEKRRERPKDPHASIPALVRIFHQVCQAVAYAHAKGVLHRDLKPENFIIGTYGQVLILDWGLATLVSEDTEEPLPELDREESTRITRVGKVVGTIAYMAPERAFGKKATVQTDIYSLGAVLYQILTLSLPFQRKNLKELKQSWETEQLTPPELVAPYREVPQILSEIVKRCLAKEPSQRYHSMDELIQSIESYLEGRSEWFLVRSLDIKKASDWQFQENVLLPEHTAITRAQDTSDWVNMMIAKDPFPDNTKIEAKIKLGPQSRGIGFLFSIPAPINRHHLTEGYCLWLNSEHEKEKKSKLSRSSVIVLVAHDMSIKCNEWINIRIEKIDSHIYVYINNILQFSYVSHLPIIGPYMGIMTRDADFEMQNLDISIGSQNAQISCLAIPDAFLANRDFDRALQEYRKLGTLFPGRTEGREALFRAGITLLEKAKTSADHTEALNLYNEAQEQFQSLRKTPGAPLEYLGKALIYQSCHEYEDEVKCFELAVRKYKQHPHLQILEEQIAIRLHESSRQNRFLTYEFALLVMRNLPHLLAMPSTKRLITSIEKHWENLWFIEHTPSHDPELHRLGFCLIIAFWLAKPYAVHETIRELLQRPILPVEEIKDGIYLLIELGAYSMAAVEMHYIRELLSNQEIKKFESSFLLFEQLIAIALSYETHPLEVSPHISTFEETRALLFALKREILKQRPDMVAHYAQALSTATKNTMSCIVDAHLIEAMLFLENDRATSLIIAGYDEEELASEKSPLYFPYICWLCHTEGKSLAAHLYATLLETQHPESPRLAAHVLAGHIDETSTHWMKQAFMYEKRVLFQSLTRFYSLAKDTEKTQKYDMLEKQEYYHEIEHPLS